MFKAAGDVSRQVQPLILMVVCLKFDLRYLAFDLSPIKISAIKVSREQFQAPCRSKF